MIKNNFRLIAFVFVFVLCGTNDSVVEESIISIPETTTSSITTTTILDTTTTVTNTDSCIPDNNSNINFQNIRNVQKFLNKYGFNAGDEDGYLGQQTVNAIRGFQSFAGLLVDGDVGANTINKMSSWTGCEEEAVSTSSNNDSATTTTTLIETDSTTTTTTTPSTTTTTIIAANTDLQNKNYGIVPHVSLTSNEVISLFKGVNTANDVCGTPYLNSLNTGLLNQYSNGLVSNSLNVFNNNVTESTITTEIID